MKNPESALLERFVPLKNIAIVEITASEREIQICDNKGNLLALRSYSPTSPIGLTVSLLWRLIQGKEYAKNG